VLGKFGNALEELTDDLFFPIEQLAALIIQSSSQLSELRVG
jgi:hypothetical protein